jgi:hypothetical protein
MKVRAFGGDQRDLREQENQPRGEQEPMEMEQRLKRGVREKVPEIIGPRETGEHQGGGHDGHRGVEEAIARLDGGGWVSRHIFSDRADLGAILSLAIRDW